MMGMPGQPQVPGQSPTQGPAAPDLAAQVGGATAAGAVSLATLADVNFDDVVAQRFENLPKMVGGFRITDAGLEEVEDHETIAARYFFEYQVIGILDVTPDNPQLEKPEECAKRILAEAAEGKRFRENFNVMKKDPAKGVGYCKAFVEDSGFPAQPGQKFLAVVKSMIGYEFPGRIEVRVNKDNKDIKYANLRPSDPAKAQQAA